MQETIHFFWCRNSTSVDSLNCSAKIWLTEYFDLFTCQHRYLYFVSEQKTKMPGMSVNLIFWPFVFLSESLIQFTQNAM